MQSRSRASRGDNFETERDEFLADGAQLPLVAVVDADENRAAAWQFLSRGKLRLREGLSVGSGNAHNLTRRAHFRAENGIHPAKLVERKNGGFDGVEIVYGDSATPLECTSGSFISARRRPTIKRAPIFASGTPVALLTKGTVRDARGLTSSTYTVIALNRVLHVHQADDFQAERQALSVIANGV